MVAEDIRSPVTAMLPLEDLRALQCLDITYEISFHLLPPVDDMQCSAEIDHPYVSSGKPTILVHY